jgi:hypothetical protein
MNRPPLPPFTAETAAQKVRMAEDAWNTNAVGYSGRSPAFIIWPSRSPIERDWMPCMNVLPAGLALLWSSPPSSRGKGPKIHFIMHEPSGIRIEFAFDPRVERPR